MLQPYVVSSYQHDCKEEGKNEGACTKQFIITPMMWRRTMVRGGKRLLLLQLLLDSWHGTQLSYTDTFKYLGMVCDKNINLTTAADAALRPFTTGTFRVKRFVQENVLTNRLHAHIWLLKIYAIPASMYASQIWSTPFFNRAKKWTTQFRSGCLQR